MPEQRQEQNRRWSDDLIETFYQEFKAHILNENAQATQQAEIHAALFQLEDRDANKPAGVVQMLGRLGEDVRALKVKDDRQKRFIGGVLFAFSCIGFFFTDAAHKVMNFLRGV